MRQKALIDIHMLMDVRYGVLRRMNAEAAHQIVKSEWYGIRDTDNFDSVTAGVIGREEYKDIYNKFEVESLVHAYMTDFLYELRKDVKTGLADLERIHSDVVFEFDVNYFPYDLLPEELTIVERSIARYLPVHCTVNMVKLDPKSLTPTILTQQYEMMALYNYESWLPHHVEALRKDPITTFCLLYPRIALSGTVPKPDGDVKDPFQALPMVMSQFIQLVVIPTQWTCANYQVFKKLGWDITAD